MTTPKSHTKTLIRTLCLGASVAMLAACGGGEEDTGPAGITVVGSSTVYPFAQKVAEQYVAGNEGAAQPSITSTGTGEGISQFCAGQGEGTIDIVNASRRMTAEEFTGCAANGVADIMEIKVGRDGIVFVSSLKDGIDVKLTPTILYRALAAMPYGKAQEVRNWSDVDGSLPEEAIEVYGPPASSGTRDALLDVIMTPACRQNGEMAALEESDKEAFEINCHALRSDDAYLSQTEQDDLIVRKVANNPRAVGVFGYSYLEENGEMLKGLTVGGVEPTAENIADGSYPASRPLYIYVKKAHLGVTPGLGEYLGEWASSWSAGGSLAGIGLVPATEEQQAASAAVIEGQTTVTGADFGIEGEIAPAVETEVEAEAAE